MVAMKQRAPVLSEDEALHVAADRYGVYATARPLPGEQDQNLLLTTEDGERYVLKISHAGEDRAVLEMQVAALAHLAACAPAIAVPRVRPALSGETIATITRADGATHLVRLLTYLPGKLLAGTNPHTPELLRALGATLGTVDRALLSFTHPAAERALRWDLPRVGWVRDYLDYLPTPARRATVEGLLARFEAEARPLLPRLRTSVVYNDAHTGNVVVSAAPPGQTPSLGLIDWGDTLRTATVCELAIACAYAMMERPDPLAAAMDLVAGYHAALPLTEDELAALYPLIGARLAISVVNSAYLQTVEPGNAYLTISEAPAWELLDRLATLPPRFAHYSFRAACGLAPCPTTPRVVRWLRRHAGQLGRLVDPDLTSEPSLIFDLSIGSPTLGNTADFAGEASLAPYPSSVREGASVSPSPVGGGGWGEGFTRILFEQMRAAGVRVGIGRYDEARPIYTSDAYRVEGNDGPEWRTVHTALDVFMEAGAPVYAPLAGVVHSFQNNAAARDYGPTIILRHTVQGGKLTFYTLYGHLSLDSLDGLRAGMPIQQGAEIARIGDESVNGGWPPHVHFQLITDLLDHHGDFPGVARPSQRAVRLSLSPDPNLLLRIPALRPARQSAPSDAAILAARHAHIGSNLSVAYRKPLRIVRGFMQYLYDDDGRKYLDAVNNVPHVGHSHPRVVRAGQRQMAILNTNTRYLHPALVRYAERLTALLPEPLSVCYFVCSGSEANELALRLARAHTGRRGIVAVDVAYHGNTSTLVDISAYKHNGPGGLGTPPWVHVVPLPDTYRGAHRDPARAGAQYAAQVATALRDAEAAGEGVAAFICESALGCGGQLVLPQGYLRAAYAHVRAAGGVCVADEVQTGFGRVGTHFWAFETQGVVSDIVTLGKPIGNGHPLGAVVTTPAIAASFDNGMEYFNTFGGNPVSCAIGLAVLDVIRDDGLQAHARRVGARLLASLRALMDRFPLVGEVRGLGLFIGVDLVLDRATRAPAPEQASYIANRMRERGVLLSTDGPFHNVLKIKPPLVFTEADADFLAATLAAVLAEDLAQPQPPA